MRIYTTSAGISVLSKIGKQLHPHLHLHLHPRVQVHTPHADTFSIKTNTRWIYDKPNMYKQLDKWKDNIPWIKPYYAVKSNPAPYLIQDIVSHPCKVGLDVASLAEIELADKYTHVGNTIYTNPHIINHEFSKYNNKIASLNIKVVDSMCELKKIAMLNHMPKILIRMNGRNTKGETNFDTKFGASEEETEELLEYAKKAKIEVCGISFHIGSGGTYNRKEAYMNAYEKALPYLNKITVEVLPEPTILNFGGGLLPDTDLEEVFGWTETLPYQMIAEPGRYISEPSHHLLTQVIAKTRRGVYLDNGIYHELNCYQRDHWKFPALTWEVTIPPEEPEEIMHKAEVESTHTTTLFGPTCDSGDTIKPVSLPTNMQAGDWILLPNMGAYTNAGKVDFNGIEGASSYAPWHLS